ncbi:MAG: hypothetical protein JRJ12_08245 [Deltaproteobacteria bacterium]|nr:hypothetical protein [Deltaproteobacteria bacterium]MBW2071163.1 hypothetical protein [Deltaproteobacteria bacterium]
MRKNIFRILVMLLALAFMASPCLAGSVTISHSNNVDQDITGGNGNPQCRVSLSKNVSFVYTRDDDNSASAQTYAIGARHDAGNKAYGTASDTTLIYWVTMTTGDITGSEISVATSAFKDNQVGGKNWVPM